MLAIGADAVVLATGSHWVESVLDEAAASHFPGMRSAIGVHARTTSWPAVFPEAGPVLLYDDDNFYLASVLAEVLAGRGLEVHFATPDDVIAGWTGQYPRLPAYPEAPAQARHPSAYREIPAGFRRPPGGIGLHLVR